MARLTSMIGEFSGKLGGIVFTRGKSGQVVRKWVVPTNANTVAQQNNRSRFADAASLFHDLDHGAQANWDAYAASNYKPKRIKAGATYSGFQALTGTFNAASQALALTREVAMTFPGSGSITHGAFTPLKDPMTGTFTGTIDDGAGNALSQTLSAATLTSAGVFTATIQLSGVTTATPSWADPGSGRLSGYQFYCSMPNKPNANPYLMSLGAIAPIATATTIPITTDHFTFSMSADDLPIANRKLWVQAGDSVKVSGFSVSARGEFQPLGAIVITVT